MSLPPCFTKLGLALLACGIVSGAHAGAPTKCDKIAHDVQESSAKEPSKVLMIVEDALVINETCACEIVKAAIVGSHADVAMAKQIVQTAVAVAPKMTPVIVECANAVMPGAADSSGVATTSKRSGKDAKNVLPEPVQPPKERDSSSVVVGDIRGVYLMAPAVGGIVTQIERRRTNTDTSTSGRRRRVIIPQSPSNAMPGWTP